MKKFALIFACGFLLAGTTAAWAGHPPVYNPCDPWIRPRPTPPPPPWVPGDFTTPEDEPETPPPVPNLGGEDLAAMDDCGEVPPPTPSPSPTPPASPTPPPATDLPKPDDPNQSFDPGQPFMEGSGKFGCSLHAVAGASPVSLGLLGLGLTTPLLWRRKRVQK